MDGDVTIMIRINCEKVQTLNGPRYKILTIQCLGSEKLPRKYLETYPHAINYIQGVEVETSDHTRYNRFINSVYTEDQISKLIEDLRLCGDNLHKINEQIKNENKNWNGTVEFCI